MLKTLTEEIIASQLSQWVQATYWLWPVLEILHFFGLTLLKTRIGSTKEGIADRPRVSI